MSSSGAVPGRLTRRAKNTGRQVLNVSNKPDNVCCFQAGGRVRLIVRFQATVIANHFCCCKGGPGNSGVERYLEVDKSSSHLSGYL